MFRKQISEKAVSLLLEKLWSLRKETMSTSYFLHEDLLQSLVYLKIHLASESSNIKMASGDITKLLEVLDDSIKKIREVYNKIVLPPIKNAGFRMVLADKMKELNKDCETRFLIQEYDESIEELEEFTIFILYSLFCEAISNAKKHAYATDVKVKINRTSNEIILEVKDNGVGFDGKESSWKEGLVKCYLTMYRVNGVMKIKSKPSKGCAFIAIIPHKLPLI